MPRKKYISGEKLEAKLRMPRALHHRLAQEAERKGMSLNFLVSALLQTGIDGGEVERVERETKAPEPGAPSQTDDSKMVAKLQVEVAQLKGIVASRQASGLQGNLSTTKITALIKKAKDGDTKRWFCDGNNLYLQISNHGAGVSWIFRWTDRATGRDRMMGLGSYHNVDLDLAREKARQCQLLLKDGKDPEVERDNAREDAKAAVGLAKTVSQVTEEFYEKKLAPSLEATTRKQVEDWLQIYVHDPIGAMSIKKVDTKTILETVGLQELWMSMNPTATQVRSLIDRIFSYAIHKGYYRGESPATWDDHLEHLLPGSETVHQGKHHSSLPYKDVGRLLEQVRAYVDAREGRQHIRTNVSFGMEFLVLTGVRCGEVLKAKWMEIDIGHMTWNVPWQHRKKGKSMRNDRPIRPVPITKPMLVVLEEMQKRRKEQSPEALVFPGAWSLSGMNRSNFNQFMKQQLKWEGHVTAHGFRSTLNDWSRANGYLEVLWKLQVDHKVGDKTAQAYGHDLLLEERRRMMEGWGDYCSQPAPEPQSGDIVNLSDKRRSA